MADRLKRLLSDRNRHDFIEVTVPHEDRRGKTARADFISDPAGERQVSGERNDAGYRELFAESGEERHRAALREAREEDSLARHAAGRDRVDQAADPAGAHPNAFLILVINQVPSRQVVPGAERIRGIHGELHLRSVHHHIPGGRAAKLLDFGRQI